MNNNPLTNQSYINKDFQTIYPELLELVKSLTYKWDPTTSNESDPGVLLIKLNAIIADKNNYNIDKNILECFPDTVTQYDNAFKLFSQLGYTMRWYKSAVGTLSITWDADPEYIDEDKRYTYRVEIPQFTMFCDADKEIVYTTTQKVEVDTDGELAEVSAIQGVIRDFTIGSRTIINPSMLDYRNRLYFPIRNVAENGIFISDAKKNASGEYEFVWDNPDNSYGSGWKRVENLNTQAPHTKCYKFGIDQSNSTCYIEFPNDFADIISEGVQIKYIQSDGGLGNVAAGRITKFYEDLKAKSGDAEIDISTNTKVTNYSSITNGLEPEEISEAYGSYKRTVGTFDTLVTLRDYLNYIVNDEFEEVSNGFVTDRTNDIQSSYEVITKTPDSEYVSTESIVSTDGEIPQMYAYDLKTYLLEYSQWPKFTSTTDVATQKSKFKDAYDKSFNLKLDTKHPLSTSEAIKNIFGETKTISHNFIPKLPCKVLMIKNKFNLSLTIIPNDSLSQSQADDIEKTIYETVLKSLHSKNINFGEEISYEMVYDICNNADARVKAVALDNIEYKPYAVVYIPKYDESISGFEDATAYYNSFNICEENGTPMTVKAGLNEIFIPNVISDNKTSLDDLTFNEKLALEICTKNILKGTTPLYHQDKSFEYSFDQTDVTPYDDIARISTYNAIEFNSSVDKDYNNEYIYMSGSANELDSKMLDNETLFLYAPSLKEIMNYETTIKYVYITDDKYTGVDGDYIPANRDYVLQRGQHLFMFWKEEDSEDAPYVYHRYGQGTILRASTKLIKYKDKEAALYNSVATRLMAVDYTGEGQIFGELNDEIKNLTGTILSTNKKVTIKEVVSKELLDLNNYCYWITNDVVGDDYRITFDYVTEPDASILASYQSGQIYLSNFSWNHTISGELYTLQGDNHIVILDPIKKKVSYNARNSGSGQVYVNEMEVTDYCVVAHLQEGDKIDCTGSIYQCPDDVFSKFKDITKTGTIVPWGWLQSQTTADTLLNMAFNTMAVTDGRWLNFLADYVGKTYRLYYTVIETKDDQGEVISTTQWWELQELGDNNTYTKIDNIPIAVTNDGSSYTFRAQLPPSQTGDLPELSPILVATPTTYTFKNGDYFKFTLPATVDENTYVEFFTCKTIGDGSYQIPVSDNICSTIGENPQWVLTNGYKIDEVRVATTPSYGTEDSKGFSKFEYLLKSGEYFAYAFDGQKGFEMLENGTKITLTIPNRDIKITEIEDGVPRPRRYNVHKIDYDSIQEQGIDAFMNNSWKNFTCKGYEKEGNVITKLSGVLVTITENQIMSLGAGTKIRVRRNGKEIPQWSEKTGHYITTVYDERFANLMIDSTGIYASKSAEGPWISYPNLLDNYTIQYCAPEDETNTWLDLPSGVGELNWDGYTILNIKSGFGTPQVLDLIHKHRFTLYDKDGLSTELDSVANNGEYNKLCIQSNVSMNLSGGDKVDVTRINVDNEILYLDILTYFLNPITSIDGVDEIDGGYRLNFSPSVTEFKFGSKDRPLGIPANIILPIEFGDEVEADVFGVFASTNGGDDFDEVVPINGPVVQSDKIAKKIYYYELPQCQVIRFVMEPNSEVSAMLKPLVKYTLTLDDESEDDKDIPIELVKEQIKVLDINGQYNYIYEPKEDKRIYNPLTAKNYFNSNHKYNKFTIPQISKVTIKVMNKR